MTVVECLSWGLFGGFAVEGLEFVARIRRTGTWPWRGKNAPAVLPFAVSVLIRLTISGGLAAAAGSSGQFAGPLGALVVGISAPLIVEKLARQTVALVTEPPPVPAPQAVEEVSGGQ
ncbi:hypothetical protein V5P93_006160 [Actinokineospora auranticolor]|uniref:Uncharacterized protein n=1 Tax=Actinokineospora auranticolor TaxID=155976 RepID=A0A2S6GGD4_9PSEU|nr:hypothetical protein [Actinokineospora auranticolor]PPK64251.1 hypothetical protein CLV40_121115 [Actinokineospora auranticolor]